MEKLFKPLLSLLLLLGTFHMVLAQSQHITMAGIVVDAASLKPVAGMSIYNNDRQLLGKTDENGYYKLELSFNQSADIAFNFNMQKDGYTAFSSTLHWAALQGERSTVFYAGIPTVRSREKVFSKEVNTLPGNSYAVVKSGLETVIASRTLDRKLDRQKNAGDKVFVVLDGAYYLVGGNGQVKIPGAGTRVRVNNDKVYTAADLNNVIKRADISFINPVEGRGDIMYEIHLKEN
ncbi:hypothetical protein [Chitinophaga sp. Cy-1792]|uniref:hypothetical protein n=1 Tax=Chitinophaga sp. Cy-1792 TaxID=2608339 RepID=UPI0014215E17|nr:hypothetical protein [Chitinophaga sp. Cy-1792]NIG57568.1 hypothetical protein [Chitinophaga sp. Cy-1792]